MDPTEATRDKNVKQDWRTRLGAGLAATWLIAAAASGGGLTASQVPYSEHSPFAGLHHTRDVYTSNDEYSIRLSWIADAWKLDYPDNHEAFDSTWSASETRAVFISVHCRADGRPEGLTGPQPVTATLVLPMHPESPDVPNWIHPRYWVIALAGRGIERTPVLVDAGPAGAVRSHLVRARIDYSLKRPDLEVALPTLGYRLLGLLASGAGGRLRARGENTDLEVRFEHKDELAEPARLALAACP